MVLHLVKLCVGVKSIKHLAELQAVKKLIRQQADERQNPFHITRMMPRRVDEILGSGSLYWVIKGSVCVRQSIVAIERITTDDGIKRCKIVLEHDLVATEIQQRRPFQGWRYLPAADAPADLTSTKKPNSLPQDIEAELRKLGAW
ncbi:DUF1489 domain-containing protein [Oceanicaulis sp. AH-315-P02]|nr:DUF1489 domain-containing protein [Robiginitomaculum sp.]MBN4047803.1 DUF1489 domain-containing protein [Oceanicaulis sp. AH-315-P02]